MSTPYDQAFQVTVERGKDVCIRCPAPHRGELQKLIVHQYDGDKLGFTANLYNSRTVCEDAEDDNSVSDVEGKDPAIYKIIATQTVAQNADKFELFDVEYAYCIQEKTHEIPDTELFLVLNVSGSGQSVTFGIGYSIQGIYH